MIDKALAIRMIVNLAFDPSLPAMVYIEKRTVRTTLKVGGTFFQVHIDVYKRQEWAYSHSSTGLPSYISAVMGLLSAAS